MTIFASRTQTQLSRVHIWSKDMGSSARHLGNFKVAENILSALHMYLSVALTRSGRVPGICILKDGREVDQRAGKPGVSLHLPFLSSSCQGSEILGPPHRPYCTSDSQLNFL